MRTCSADNCNFPVFGTDKNTGEGYCQRHQWMRTDRKPKNPAFRAKREPLRDFSFGFDNQTDLFFYKWDEAKNERAEVICKYTGEHLNRYRNRQAFWSCFAHVLPKGRFPYFKLNPDNIRVVDPVFHRIIDQGTTEDRKIHPGWNFDLWDREVEEMKVAYQEYKISNLLS